jgi:hypothetical protein
MEANQLFPGPINRQVPFIFDEFEPFSSPQPTLGSLTGPSSAARALAEGQGRHSRLIECNPGVRRN